MRDRTAESNPASVLFGHMLSPHVALVAATRSPARTPAASAAPPGATRTTKSPAAKGFRRFVRFEGQRNNPLRAPILLHV